MNAHVSVEEGKKAADVARDCDLVAVRPVFIEARLVEPAPDDTAELQPSISMEMQQFRGDRRFAIAARFQLEGLPKPEGMGPVIRIRYIAVADYSLKGGETTLPDDDSLAAFAKTDAMAQLWPYFVTFVQSACAQLGIPPPTLPPIRFRVSDPTEVPRSATGSARR